MYMKLTFLSLLASVLAVAISCSLYKDKMTLSTAKSAPRKGEEVVPKKTPCTLKVKVKTPSPLPRKSSLKPSSKELEKKKTATVITSSARQLPVKKPSYSQIKPSASKSKKTDVTKPIKGTFTSPRQKTLHVAEKPKSPPITSKSHVVATAKVIPNDSSLRKKPQKTSIHPGLKSGHYSKKPLAKPTVPVLTVKGKPLNPTPLKPSSRQLRPTQKLPLKQPIDEIQSDRSSELPKLRAIEINFSFTKSFDESTMILSKGASSTVGKNILSENNQEVAVRLFKYQSDYDKEVYIHGTISSLLAHPSNAPYRRYFVKNYGRLFDANLQGEKILGKFDAGLVSEYIPMNLNDFMRKFEKLQIYLPPLLIITIMEQITTALYFMHENHLVHLDLKPGNILVSLASDFVYDQKELKEAVDSLEYYRKKVTIKIIDFNLSADLKAKDPKFRVPENYNNGINMGTNWYRAVELVLLTGTPTQAVDVWSLGIIFLDIVLGCPFFSGIKDSKDEYATLYCILPLIGELHKKEPSFDYHTPGPKIFSHLQYYPSNKLHQIWYTKYWNDHTQPQSSTELSKDLVEKYYNYGLLTEWINYWRKCGPEKEALSLLTDMLNLDCSTRITMAKILQKSFFKL